MASERQMPSERPERQRQPAGPKHNYTLEINLTKSKWEPKTVDEIPQVISRAFETHVALKEVQPLVGTDHIKKWPIKDDKDIPVFMAAKSQMNEAFAEKVIKFTVPRGLMPSRWEPKKVKILARGERISKFFGEEEVGSRNVEVSLKFFDCGHFYMKQTLPGSGAAPYQIVFEGAFRESASGFHLDYLLRYTGQTSKKTEFDEAVSILPPQPEGLMAFCNETDNQLNGLIPAIVGGEQLCRVEIYREPDVVEKVKARFNEDCPDPVSWSDPPPPQDRKREKPKKAPPREQSPPTSQPLTKEKEETGSQGVRPVNQARQTSSASSAASASSATPTSWNDDESLGKEDEQMWPVIVGLVFFVMIFVLFGWLNWLDRSAASVTDTSDDWFR